MSIASISSKYIKRKLTSCGLIEKFIELEGAFMHCYDNGSKKPAIMLLNGFGASTEFQWFKITKALCKDHRVVVVNLLNFGRSKPKDEADCKLQDQVKALHDLLVNLKIEKAHVLGISYGGLVATEFANTHEEKTTTLTLINSPTKFLNLAEIESFLRSESIDSVKDFFTPKDHKGLKEQFRLAYHSTMWLPNFVAKSFYTALCEPYVDGWTRIVDNLLENYEELSNRSYKIKCKTILIWGENDRIIPVKVGEQLNQHFSNSSLHLISKCGHLPTIEKPKQCTEIILKHVLAN